MSEPDPNASFVEVRTYFVRGRNALVARAQFEPMYIDYYLHCSDHALHLAPAHDTLLKEALACMTLHLASRPQDENVGWTLHFNEPHLNLFVTGKSRPGAVTGRIFTDAVRDTGKNLWISQISRPHHAPLQSMVEVSSTDIFRSVEEYYLQSEQRVARLLRMEEEDIVLVTAQPDCDDQWLRELDEDDLRVLDQTEQLGLLEQRQYFFHCGCSVERLYPILDKLSETDLKDVFAEAASVTMTCPRCGAQYEASRDSFMAWRSSRT